MLFERLDMLRTLDPSILNSFTNLQKYVANFQKLEFFVKYKSSEKFVK